MERDPMEMALSTDLIMDIVLRHLDLNDLLSCREVSKFWKKAASSELRRRSTMVRPIFYEEYLMKLRKCIERSSDFPFVGLTFDKPWKLNSDRAMEFFQKHGPRFTRLRLNTSWIRRLHDLAPFIDHLPRLSILEVGASADVYRRVGGFLDSDAEQEDGKILKLPSVQIIRICCLCYEVNEEVLREVFTAASPSLRVECLSANPSVLRALDSAGKLRALSSIRFIREADDRNSEVQFEMDRLFSTESPALIKVDFAVDGYLSRDGLKRILFSSQHTLKELDLFGMCLFEKSWDEFPVFTKLTKLSLCVGRYDVICESLSRGTNGYKFPALKQLKLNIPYERYDTLQASFSDGSFVVPSVTRIDFQCYVNQNGMKMLAEWFPNVTEVRLQYRYESCLGEEVSRGFNPLEMWNVREFNRLEKLRIWNYRVEERLLTKDYINMDRFLTGMPFEICENLRKHERLDLVNSPFNEVLRYNPSILQLKNLQELVVCVRLGSGLIQPAEETPFISMVSVWYALDMMPRLRAKFVYDEFPRPYYRIEDQTKAALEAAFKLVQPSVKLEPFFY